MHDYTLNFDWFCIMWIYALQRITTSSFEYSRNAVWLHWVMQMLSPDRLCVFTVWEWGLWIFSPGDSTKVSGLFSLEHTCRLKTRPFKSRQTPKLLQVLFKASTMPTFAPGALLVARLSNFRSARTSSGERLPSSLLSRGRWALIKLQSFRKVLTQTPRTLGSF